MKNYGSFATELAYQAGGIMRENFSLGMKKSFKKKDNSPVTISDTAINKLVISSIAKQFPEHSVMGEEESSEKKNEYVWLCDPIDGTIPFSSGIPVSTFSLALTKNGVPIVGVIYDPFMDRLYFAEKGKGAFLNNQKIKVSQNRTINNQVLYMGWWKYSLYDLLFVRRELNNKGCKIIDFCSFAYAGSLVAAGELSAVIFGDRFPWDGAAVKLIVEEAGGICTDLNGIEQRYDGEINGFIASNKYVHEGLVSLVKQFGVKNQ